MQAFTVQNQPINWTKIPKEMGPSLRVVVSCNALCSFSCIPGLSLSICFLTDLVITAACSWKSFPARKQKQICYLFILRLANNKTLKVKVLLRRAPRLRFFTLTWLLTAQWPASAVPKRFAFFQIRWKRRFPLFF